MDSSYLGTHVASYIATRIYSILKVLAFLLYCSRAGEADSRIGNIIERKMPYSAAACTHKKYIMLKVLVAFKTTPLQT